MWIKTVWIRHPVRLELTREGLLVKLTIHYTIWGALERGEYNSLQCLDHDNDYNNNNNASDQK